MPTSDSYLDKAADIRTLRRLHQNGLLSDTAYAHATALLRPPSAWYAWARRMLLFVGSGLVLAGVVFFFAYNWSAMERLFKFALIEAGILACVIGCHARRRTQLSGKVLLLSASVLVGVFLAVYGQTYQTGADAFELFAGWAVLIFGWVVISEFGGLWLLWLVLVNAGAILYWRQVAHPCYSTRYEYLCLALAALNGSALTLFEVARRQAIGWLSGKWLRNVLLAASLAALSFPALGLILGSSRNETISLVAASLWALAAAGVSALYRFRLREMVPIALAVASASLVLLAGAWKVLIETSRLSLEGPLLLFAFFILAVVTGAVIILRRTASAMSEEAKGGGV